MSYHVIYDGNCNLCTTLTQWLETFDKGQTFDYIPMQDRESLEKFGISPEDCELGMILIDANNPQRRWQGSDAAEEIANLLPMGEGASRAAARSIALYRSLPGVKWLGDRAYTQIRDNRYSWFGKRSNTYGSSYPYCESACQSPTATNAEP